MQPITRFWIKILVATVELILLLTAAIAIGGNLPAWVGAIVLTVLFAERMFYILGGVSGYASYTKEAKRRAAAHNHRP